jgi:hypothetical protein
VCRALPRTQCHEIFLEQDFVFVKPSGNYREESMETKRELAERSVPVRFVLNQTKL